MVGLIGLQCSPANIFFSFLPLFLYLYLFIYLELLFFLLLVDFKSDEPDVHVKIKVLGLIQMVSRDSQVVKITLF